MTFGAAEDVYIRESLAASHHTLHGLRRETALRRLRRTFHVQDDRVAIDLLFDAVQNVHVRFTS